MKCPDCGEKLREVFATSHYGAKIALDQCFGCGGIWFDDFELHSIPEKEIKKIEIIDSDKLQEKSFLGKANNLCPKCSVKLEIFKDCNFPKQLKAEYCQNCGGFWMNRGEATDFKFWQEGKKVDSNKLLTEEDKKFQEEIKSILASSKSDNFGMLGKIGKILSTRIDSKTYLPIKSGNYMEIQEKTEAEKATSFLVRMILILLRLFLRR